MSARELLDAVRRICLEVPVEHWSLPASRRSSRSSVATELGSAPPGDFYQAAGRLLNRKYEAHGGPGLDTMARIIAEHSSNPIEDRWAAGELLAVNYIAGSPDGHAKNISLALWPEGTHVAPLYDLATSLPYDPRNPALRTVALSVGGRLALRKVLGKHWDRAAHTLGVRTRALPRLQRPIDDLVARLDDPPDPGPRTVSRSRSTR